jgi:hypothetical protein
MNFVNKSIKKPLINQVLVAHACNPSYLGGRDPEDHGLKPDPGE